MVGLMIGIGCSTVLAAIVAILWVRGINYMKENHAGYIGDDFLNNDPDK
jgi:hypothetical protein